MSDSEKIGEWGGDCYHCREKKGEYRRYEMGTIDNSFDRIGM